MPGFRIVGIGVEYGCECLDCLFVLASRSKLYARREDGIEFSIFRRISRFFLDVVGLGFIQLGRNALSIGDRGSRLANRRHVGLSTVWRFGGLHAAVGNQVLQLEVE